MKIRNKITIIIITITFAFVFLSNSIFSYFFSNYLENQENAQINSISRSVESFFIEKIIRYQGNVIDYSHWDDSYDFINNINRQKYIDSNLVEDTFSNLEVNFIFYVGEDNSIIYKQYYDNTNKKFTQFPAKLAESIEKFIRASKSEDISKILKLGDQFYFVATSDITDSSKVKKSKGRMLIGSLIDEKMVIKLKEMNR